MSSKPSYPVVNALFLRKLADAAASRRDTQGEPAYAWVTKDMNGKYMLVFNLKGEPPESTVFEVDTLEVWAGRTPPSKVVMTHSEKETKNLADRFDAVFWSEAAVEKFVLPYYASKELWDAAAELKKLSKAWYGKVPSLEEGVSDAVEPIPYAIGHTPDSDWQTLTSGDTNAKREEFQVLFTHHGQAWAMGVTEFVQKHRKSD